MFALLLVISGTVITFAPVSKGTEVTLKVVHTNDINGRISADEWNKSIGMPKLKTIIDNNIQNCDINLVLDSGDAFYGQPITDLVKGESVAKLMGACGYDAITVGNHDWNYGKKRLKELVGIANKNSKKDFMMLAGNVKDKNEKLFFDDEFLIKTIKKEGLDFKVGVFGVIDPELYKDTAPSNVDGIIFTDMKKYAEQAVTKLKDKGCQFIVGLVHSDNPVGLATSLEGVNLWVAGQDGIDINQTVFTPSGQKSFVMRNNPNLNEVGVIELKCVFSGEGEIAELSHIVTRIDYDKSVDTKEDKNVSAILTKFDGEKAKKEGKVVGKSPAYLIRQWEDIRIAEMPLGRAITDAYIIETGADIAFENAAAIKDSILFGDVTYKDIHKVLPYGYYVVTKELTGTEILSILEASVEIQRKNIVADESGIESAWPTNSGNFLQVGGMTARYNLSAKYGSRVYGAKIDGIPLVGSQTYTVAMSNNLANNYSFPQLTQHDESNEFGSCEEAFSKYFKQSKKDIMKSISEQRMIKGTGEEDAEKLIVQQLPQGSEIIATADEALREEPTTVPNANNGAVNNGAVNNGAVQNNTTANQNNGGSTIATTPGGKVEGKTEPPAKPGVSAVPTGSNNEICTALLSLVVMTALFMVVLRRRKEELNN